MDTSGRLRRHNSTPAQLKSQRYSSLLPSRLRLKTNPYIGSFRHSPPTSFRSVEACAWIDLSPSILSSSLHLRRSPYIGWFRHAPPMALQLHNLNKDHLPPIDNFRKPFMFDESLHDGKYNISTRINGRLRGGGIDSNKVFRYVHRVVHESSTTESTLGTLKLLGSWFLFPLAYDAESCGYKTNSHRELASFSEASMRSNSFEEESYLEDYPESDFDEDSDESSSVVSHDWDGFDRLDSVVHTDEALGVSVSNVAEAYYAHQAIDHGDEISSDGHNLDYVITQMDIARMARNASRHLEVDCILKLPTITYHHLPPIPEQAGGSGEDDNSWSFVMVKGMSADQTSVSHSSENDNSCVICLEHFVEGDRLRVLPCQHSFHVGCIDRWLSGSHSHLECYTSGCPICKKRPLDIENSARNDGSVPSWAFSNIGQSLSSRENNREDCLEAV